jgi:hypothetical protein
MPTQRQYQGTCEWIATRGAAMPKRWRSFQKLPLRSRFRE